MVRQAQNAMRTADVLRFARDAAAGYPLRSFL